MNKFIRVALHCSFECEFENHKKVFSLNDFEMCLKHYWILLRYLLKFGLYEKGTKFEKTLPLRI